MDCLFFVLLPYFLSAQQKVDVLITNGRIVDGTGNPWYKGDVAIKDGKIVGVGQLKNMKAAQGRSMRRTKSLLPVLLMCIRILKAMKLKIPRPIILFTMG